MYYSGTLGDFASFVTHMKALAKVSPSFFQKSRVHDIPRKKTWISFLLTQAICTTVDLHQRDKYFVAERDWQGRDYPTASLQEV